MLEPMMDGELEKHLNEEKASGNINLRNSKTKKTVRGLSTLNRPVLTFLITLFQ